MVRVLLSECKTEGRTRRACRRQFLKRRSNRQKIASKGEEGPRKPEIEEDEASKRQRCVERHARVSSTLFLGVEARQQSRAWRPCAQKSCVWEEVEPSDGVSG